LWEVNKIKFPRVYFTSSHPKDLDDEVIDALGLESVGNYLHLAVQSGDDEVIKNMNRHYTASHYLNLIKKIRNKKPNIAIGTDIIVGFPGESEEAFNNTCKLYKEADFDISYTAIYSDRSGTASEKMKNKIDFKTKRNRWNRLHDLMEEIVLTKNQKYLNKIVSVLVEDKTSKYWFGHSSEQKVVKFPITEEDYVGQIIDVKIEKAEEWN
ncbi:MAG: radical SAM protein, partial [Patescibacteria group bacterium]